MWPLTMQRNVQVRRQNAIPGLYSAIVYDRGPNVAIVTGRGSWNNFTGQPKFAAKVIILQEATFVCLQGFTNANLTGD
jgi:hypothetical protein